MTKQPRTLVFDIELSPIVAYVWDRREQNIGLNQIRNDWYVLAWAAKWLNEPASKVVYYDQRHAKDTSDDTAILRPLWKLLDEADIVITQNGKNFDSPKLNSRFILHGMRPPSTYKHLDTYQLVRRVAKFTSNSLEYLTDKLNKKYKKLKHKNFPGMSLWDACLKGNVKAWDEMKKYNIHDVLSTEELYNTIQAWTPQTMPNPAHECPRRFLIKDGSTMRRDGAHQVYRCKKCGTKITGEKK